MSEWSIIPLTRGTPNTAFNACSLSSVDSTDHIFYESACGTTLDTRSLRGKAAVKSDATYTILVLAFPTCLLRFDQCAL